MIDVALEEGKSLGWCTETFLDRSTSFLQPHIYPIDDRRFNSDNEHGTAQLFYYTKETE